MAGSIIKELGPLALLVGVWEGDKGNDRAPSDDRGVEMNLFRERITFEPLSTVNNHEQTLFGLRYSTVATRLGEVGAFHEELGYWLWDAKAKQVLRCFVIPRGINVIAGGTAEPNARSFELMAKVGSETYGICSNRFLDREFKTVRYDLKVVIHDSTHFSYEEDSQIKIKGQSRIFHHRDQNSLHKIR